MADVRWLGFDWGDNLFHASDYFEQLYAWAVHLIEHGDAFVDDLSADEIRETRGTLTSPGTNSPFRDRTVEENLDLFTRMRAGEFANGARVLRAKIDMASPNINLRDPVLYRIVHATHPRTGDAWCIYPTYDFAHGQSDAIEGVTHSICTLEFEVHRPLYDWLIEHLPVPHVPHQYEFARLNITHIVLSKRFLLKLVQDGYVRGWDDPRMPTIAGLRRRGFPAEGIRNFATEVGVAKADATHDVALLEHEVRGVLNRTSQRRFGVIDPIKVVIENFPDDLVETMEVVNNPEDESAGERAVPFSRELWIERDDFMEEPRAEVLPPVAGPRGPPPERVLHHLHGRHQGRGRARHRAPRDLRPGHARRRLARRPAAEGDAPLGVGRARRSRPRSACTTTCSRAPIPGAGGDLFAELNPALGDDRRGARCWSPRSRRSPVGETVQFERLGYFTPDADSTPDALVFNRTLTLKDTWAKVQAKGSPRQQRPGKVGLSDDSSARDGEHERSDLPVQPSARRAARTAGAWRRMRTRRRRAGSSPSSRATLPDERAGSPPRRPGRETGAYFASGTGVRLTSRSAAGMLHAATTASAATRSVTPGCAAPRVPAPRPPRHSALEGPHRDGSPRHPAWSTWATAASSPARNRRTSMCTVSSG